MLNEKCYGILSDESIVFNPKELKQTLKNFCIDAIHNGPSVSQSLENTLTNWEESPSS